MVPTCPFSIHRPSTELSWFPIKSVDVESWSHKAQKKPQQLLNSKRRQLPAETSRSCEDA
jgi:hypothetical protein